MKYLKSLAVLALGCAFSTQAAAQAFPNKQVRFIISSLPGNAADSAVRYIAGRVKDTAGWNTLVENRPGGDNTIGIQAVLQAPPDGHTIYQAVMSLTLLPFTKKDLPYDFVKDFSPLVRFAELISVVVVNPAVPAKTLNELIAYSKANPGKVHFGGNQTGTSAHMLAELIRSTGVNLVYVPYKGSVAAIGDLVENRVQMGYSTYSDYDGLIKQGKLRPLLTMNAKRNPAIPDTPTAVEASGGNENLNVTSWLGFVAPSRVPRETRAILEKELLAVAHLKDVQDFLLNKASLTPVTDNAEEFGRKIAADMRRWDKTIQDGKIKFD